MVISIKLNKNVSILAEIVKRQKSESEKLLFTKFNNMLQFQNIQLTTACAHFMIYFLCFLQPIYIPIDAASSMSIAIYASKKIFEITKKNFLWEYKSKIAIFV